jgi:hypothetical protein
VRLPNAPGEVPIPWLVSNPLYVGVDGASAPQAPVASGASPASIAPFPWRIEKDPASSAIVRTRDHSVELAFQLAGGPRNSQFVALATDIHDQEFSAIRLGLQADRPCRVWVQVRTPAGLRWGRTYYVDPAGVELLVDLRDLHPLGQGPIGVPNPKSLGSILLVTDLTNNAPGHSGTLTVVSSDLVK